MRLRLAAVVYLAAATSLACAQATSGFEIHGAVRDPSVNVAIADATVTLSEVTVADSQLKSTVLGVVSTDSTGAFRFSLDHAGDFTVAAKKDGYTSLSYSSSEGLTGSGTVPIRLTRERPGAEIQFFHVRPGELRGHLVDDQGKPIANQLITLLTAQPSPQMPITGTAISDRDGFFVFPKLLPNSYVVRTGPLRTEGRSIAPYSADEFKVVDEDFETLYWPGATSDLKQASAIRLESGGRVDLGDLKLRRISYFRVHVSLLDPCTPGATWRLQLLQSGAPGPLGASKAENFPCSQDFLLRDVTAGSYLFALSNEAYGAEALWATATVTVASRNVEVKMAVSGPGEIAGRLVPVEGGTLPSFHGLTVWSSASPPTLGGETPQASVDSEGKFVLKDLSWPERTIQLRGLGGSFYVREIGYNGAPVKGGVVPVARGATPAVEIVIDNQAAVLSGTVANGSHPAGRASVILQRWPLESTELDAISWRFLFGTGQTDDRGTFRISGIAPGEYKVVAVPQWLGASQPTPGALARLLSTGETVVLGRGEAKNLDLKLADPQK